MATGPGFRGVIWKAGLFRAVPPIREDEEQISDIKWSLSMAAFSDPKYEKQIDDVDPAVTSGRGDIRRAGWLVEFIRSPVHGVVEDSLVAIEIGSNVGEDHRVVVTRVDGSGAYTEVEVVIFGAEDVVGTISIDEKRIVADVADAAQRPGQSLDRAMVDIHHNEIREGNKLRLFSAAAGVGVIPENAILKERLSGKAFVTPVHCETTTSQGVVAADSAVEGIDLTKSIRMHCATTVDGSVVVQEAINKGQSV